MQVLFLSLLDITDGVPDYVMILGFGAATLSTNTARG